MKVNVEIWDGNYIIDDDKDAYGFYMRIPKKMYLQFKKIEHDYERMQKAISRFVSRDTKRDSSGHIIQGDD